MTCAKKLWWPEVGCHLFLETSSIISIVPCLPLRLWISNKGFYGPWCCGDNAAQVFICPHFHVWGNNQASLHATHKETSSHDSAGQFGNNSKGFFPLGCYDHSSLMESHLHRALFLVTGTVPFHCRAATGLKISSLSC
jgi:hypothetical protein